MAEEEDRDLIEIQRRIVYLEFSERSRMAEWLGLIAEFDRRHGTAGTRFRGTAEWLSFECGVTPRTAREHVRVARRLADWPLIAERFADGFLSYSQVRALSRADAEEDEAALLRVALTSTAPALERHVRQLRSAPSADLDTANLVQERRFVKWFWKDDGALSFFGRLGPDAGQALVEAIETGVHLLGRGPAEPDQPRPPLGARRADALAELALSGAPRTHLILHADPEALACRATGPEPRAGDVCHLEGGPAIPSELARRLTCDCEISINGLHRGRTTRVVSRKQRRALELRDGRVCAMPGCDRSHGLQAHHIEPWALGGETNLDNLALFCHHHHRCFHEDGFTLRRCRNGTLLIRDRRGHELHQLPVRGSPGQLLAA